MTTRLYYDDAYLTRFEADVVRRADGGLRVYLDRTAFYPTSGGQPHDLGTLGSVEVLDVVDEDVGIAHVLAAPLEGEHVAGRVDWARRFDHMQQHTGQHLLSAVLESMFEWPTISVHFGSDLSTLDVDVDAAAVTPERVRAAEARANALIVENRPLTVTFEDAATVTGLRRTTQREGTLRIVTIADVDRSACGGTHVRATGEIGPILIRRTERVRKGTRLEFTCGLRAVRRARADYDALARLGQALSAAPDDVPGLVEMQGERLRDAETRLRRLDGELAALVARARWEAARETAPGRRVVVERREAADIDQLRAFAQAVGALPNGVCIAAGSAPAPVVVLATAPGTGLDAGALLKRALADAGGRGGGSPRQAQGTVPSVEQLEQVVAALEREATGGDDAR